MEGEVATWHPTTGVTSRTQERWERRSDLRGVQVTQENFELFFYIFLFFSRRGSKT